jgi:hypothetical protein
LEPKKGYAKRSLNGWLAGKVKSTFQSLVKVRDPGALTIIRRFFSQSGPPIVSTNRWTAERQYGFRKTIAFSFSKAQSTSLMVFSKNRITFATIWLLGVVAAPQVPAQETGGDVESFNRSLGLEEMGADLTNVEQELAHGNPSGPAEGSKKVAVKQKRAPVQQSQSTQFSDLAFRSDPGVTDKVVFRAVKSIGTSN